MARSQANQLVQSAVATIQNAAAILMNSKFSESAIDKFRARIRGVLSREVGDIAALAWKDGNGADGVPGDIARSYLSEQMHFLEGWIEDIAKAGKLVGGAGRAALYGESLGQVYQRAYFLARGSRVGLPDLPAYPRDGSTVCRVRCRCQWKIVKRANDLYEATWRLGQAEHCPDCLERSQEWSPLRLLLINEKWELFTQGQPGLFEPARI
jgi:hypothetical protein